MEGDIPVNFIIVEDPQETQDQHPVVQKFQLSLSEFLLFTSPIITSDIDPEDYSLQFGLFDAIMRRALSIPPGSDQIFACVIRESTSGPEEDCWFFGSIKTFNVVIGTEVEEEKAVSWDLVDSSKCSNEVLRACKPPIPCLRKIEVGDLEDLSCPICLQDIYVGSEPVSTTCCHVFHGCCIVEWLLKSTVCPMCRCRLLVG